MLQVTNSPFNQEQADLFNRLLPNLTKEQLIWLSGYLAALYGVGSSVTIDSTLLASPGTNLALSGINDSSDSKEVTVLFGSQTGNCQRLSKDLSRRLEELGFNVSLFSMSDFKPNSLKKVRNLLILVSTHGEGDPPDNALPFFEFLHSKRAPQLEDLQYSVLALGDSSYEFFCKTGKDFDQRLDELGGKRLCPRTDCDLDYDEPVLEWFNNVVSALGKIPEASALATEVTLAVGNGFPAEQSGYSRTFPFEAEVLENLNLNGRGSNQETRHIELSLAGSKLQFEPGDALGIYPTNHPELVDRLISEMGWNPEEHVPANKKGDERLLREALLHHYEITVLTKPLLEQMAQLSSNNRMRELLEPGHEPELRAYMDGRDLLDVVQDFPFSVPAGQFVSILRKMPARLYSISSSLKANPDEVHLTIRALRYNAHGRDRYGVCSVQSAERLLQGDTLPVYVHQNPNFKLPPTPDKPIIMIGPGTGVAPFRAFLNEREENGDEGKTWLFFGDQHFLTDFLYQIDWQKWLKKGVLSRMDVAFSRDTDKKIYVQHRMLEKSRELFQWLEEGAYVYVCGDEKRMAHDVHNTLITILEREGGMDPEAAAAYLTEMQRQRRYQRDIY